MGCYVVAEFLLTSVSRGPSAIAEPLVHPCYLLLHFPLLYFPLLHFLPLQFCSYRIFHSRILSLPMSIGLLIVEVVLLVGCRQVRRCRRASTTGRSACDCRCTCRHRSRTSRTDASSTSPRWSSSGRGKDRSRSSDTSPCSACSTSTPTPTPRCAYRIYQSCHVVAILITRFLIGVLLLLLLCRLIAFIYSALTLYSCKCVLLNLLTKYRHR